MAGTTVKDRKPIVKSKLAAFPASSVIVTLWVPSAVAAGTLNLRGVKVAVAPDVLSAVALPEANVLKFVPLIFMLDAVRPVAGLVAV